MKILFASQNQHKIAEVSKILPTGIQLMGLAELSFDKEIIESADTLEGNALIKCREIFENFAIPTFSDDTGLFIEALKGEPGVYSARWKNLEPQYNSNINKALKLLEGKEERNAYFKTVIAFKTQEEEFLFEGRVDGKIISELRGNEGFGYDPIFIPDGYDSTFAEMSTELKNKISHRGLAMKEFMNFLSNKYQG